MAYKACKYDWKTVIKIQKYNLENGVFASWLQAFTITMRSKNKFWVLVTVTKQLFKQGEKYLNVVAFSYVCVDTNDIEKKLGS